MQKNDTALAGAVLMGGMNSRMNGQKKAYLVWEGQTFLERALEKIQGLDTIYLSVEERQKLPEEMGRQIIDLYPRCGPIGGIYSVLRAAGQDAVLFLPCDMPLLPAAVVGQLAETWYRTSEAVIFSCGGRINPLIGVYPKSCVEIIAEQIGDGNYRMQDLCRRLPCHTVNFTESEETENWMRNINHPEDYEYLRE